jgi:hypothetical protein
MELPSGVRFAGWGHTSVLAIQVSFLENGWDRFLKMRKKAGEEWPFQY